MKQLREPDMWWQLLTGRWMLENGEVTKTDMFSYTMEGTKWVNVKWLYEVLVAFMEKGLGPHAVMLLQSLVNIAIVYLLLRILTAVTKHLGQQTSTLFSTTAVLAFLAICEFRMAGRPEMISHLFTILYTFILWQSHDFSWKKIWWLIPLQCLWANMHEGYPVGMAIIGMYIAGGFIAHLLNKDKGYLQSVIRLCILFLGMGAAVLINPNFIELWQHSAEIFRQLSVNKYTTELFSVAQPEYWNVQGKAHIILLVSVSLFWIVRIIQNKKEANPIVFNPLLTGYLIAISVMGYLSLTANRNIPFAQIVLMPSVPLMLIWLTKTLKLQTNDTYNKVAKQTALISAALGIIFYLLIVSNKYYSFTESPNKYGIHLNTLNNPTSSSEFIKTYNLKGPAFSDYFVSSYLLWDLYPNFKSYIDLRDLDIFPSEFFSDYFDLYNEPSKFYDLDSIYKFNYIVLSTSQMSSLQSLLYWRDGFNVVHVDPVSIVLLRDTEENTAINRGPAAQQLFSWPQEAIDPGWAVALTTLFNPNISYEEEEPKYAPLYAARFYNTVQNYRIAIKLLRAPIVTDFSDNAEALTTMGQSYIGDADFSDNQNEKSLKMDTARMYLERSLSFDDKHSSTYLALASLSIASGLYQQSRDFLSDFFKLDKTNDFAYFMDGVCARNIWHNGGGESALKDAVESFEKSVDLNEKSVKSYLYLTETYWALGDKDKARMYIKEVLKYNVGWAPHEQKLLDTLVKWTGTEKYKSSMDLLKKDDTHNHEHEHEHEHEHNH